MEWLEQLPDTSSQSETGDTSALNLLETLKVKHFVADILRNNLSTIFTMSLSGSIGIRYTKPTLSVMYPGTKKPPLILSRDDKYTSVLFITISNQEYLVAASTDSIHLWNLEKSASSVVYKFKEQNIWHLCLIDEQIVACVAEQPSSDGFIHIRILKTDAEMWNLSSSHLVKASHAASDISFAKTTDGTECLLLLYKEGRFVQCVEMFGGKVRWKVDKQQMGKMFYPWNICTDVSTIFFTSVVENKLHILSVEDGSVLMSISLRPFDIVLPGCVRLQEEHLYVGHLNDNLDTDHISKIIKPT